MSLNVRKIALSLLLLLCSLALYAQTGQTVSAPAEQSGRGADISFVRPATPYQSILNIEVHFRFDDYTLDPQYMGNDVSLQILSDQIDSIGLERLDSIVIVSYASPEGVYEHNISLAEKRKQAMHRYIMEHHPQLADKLTLHAEGESWQLLREYVLQDTQLSQASIEKTLAVIDADINIGTKKWRMEQLPVYRYLRQTYYPLIRNSMICILYHTEPEPVVEEPIVVEEPPVEPIIEEPVIEVVEEVVEEVVAEPQWSPRLLVGTNAVALGMGIANASVELDLREHLSVALPIQYSAWNYFSQTTKFRTLALYPELRYWFSPENDGLFAGVHLGCAQYNFAFGGDYRYQDHDGTSPALGGGLSVGYRLPISSNNRLRMEFSLGAGCYALHYDRFVNTPKTKDGLLVDTHKKTYWGLDRAAITLSYSFDLTKKGGLR